MCIVNKLPAMRTLLMFGLIFLAACSKNDIDTQSSFRREGKEQSCDFGIKSFSLTKRTPVNPGNNEVLSKKPTSGGGGTVTPGSGVILIDFDGQLVSGTAWNTNGDISCAPANLTAAEISIVVQRVMNDYSPFNIMVTTDETVYNAANINRRVRVIVTETWEWHGQAGGVSFLNSFTSGTNTPSFVFSSLLGYNSKYIAEAVSHEAGHTFGLLHQASYDANCVKLSDYNTGQGTGENGWAPIMGASYYQNLTLWYRGPNSAGCNSIQDDLATISAIVGYKTDDYSNSISSAAILTGSLDGTINNNRDLDFFSINISTSKTILLTPFNVGAYNAGANTDLILRLYNSKRALVSTIDNPGVLNAAVSLSPGNYYISVGTITNSYATTYGMLGKYNISLY